MPHPPKVHSFLIADQVFQQKTGKWCIVGVFDRILAPQYPVSLYAVGLFVRLSDAEGEYQVKIEFRGASDQVLAVLPEVRLRVPNRLAAVDFGIQSHNLVIPAPGKYFFKLYFNGIPAHDDIHLEAGVQEAAS